MPQELEFPVNIGETLLRTELHKRVGGTTQSGMTSCQKGASFLVFHNPKKGRKFGYDHWEGLQADGTFWYTGQGVSGDQELTRSNRKLLDFAYSGKPIHFFISEGSETRYQGRVDLAQGEYVWKYAPDENRIMRRVIVFKFLPLMKNILLSSSIGIDPLVTCNYEELNLDYSRDPILWKKRDILDVFKVEYEREFGNLVNQFLTVHGKKGDIRLDFCDRNSKKLFFAVNSVADESLSIGIGKITNYLKYLEVVDDSFTCHLVLPQNPGSRFLMQLRQKNIGSLIL